MVKARVSQMQQGKSKLSPYIYGTASAGIQDVPWGTPTGFSVVTSTKYYFYTAWTAVSTSASETGNSPIIGYAV